MKGYRWNTIIEILSPRKKLIYKWWKTGLTIGVTTRYIMVITDLFSLRSPRIVFLCSPLFIVHNCQILWGMIRVNTNRLFLIWFDTCLQAPRDSGLKVTTADSNLLLRHMIKSGNREEENERVTLWTNHFYQEENFVSSHCDILIVSNSGILLCIT